MEYFLKHQKFNLNIIVLGYEWEKENSNVERATSEREIKMKHKRHFLVLLFAERKNRCKNVLCLCECGFYSIFDCIIVQLETTKQMNEWTASRN